jgi:dTDP-4-dehydrorhamnose 3,5-epimerase
MTFQVRPTRLAGALVVEGARRSDARGWFERLFCEEQLSKILQGRRIVQVNQSNTATAGAARGLHFQHRPHAEMKLVRCLRGRAWDVAVDLRAGSATFLSWHAEELSPESGKMFVIPEGFAHGFQALERDTELLYLHTAGYAPAAEAGLHCQDPALGIDWPLPVQELSERDRSHRLIDRDFKGVEL